MQRRNYETQSGAELASAMRKKALNTPDVPVSGRPATDFGAALPVVAGGMKRRSGPARQMLK